MGEIGTGTVMIESVTGMIPLTTEVSINVIAIATTERSGSVVRKKATMTASKGGPGIIETPVRVLISCDS